MQNKDKIHDNECTVAVFEDLEIGVWGGGVATRALVSGKFNSRMMGIPVHFSLCTTLCLQWESDIIAVALMYLASRLSKIDFSVSFKPGACLRPLVRNVQETEECCL